MLLAVEIGNTDIVYGIHDHTQWKKVWRTPSSPVETAAYYESDIRLHFLESGSSIHKIEQVVFSNVVPSLNPIILPMLSRLFGTQPIIVGIHASAGLTIDIDFPHEIGSDLIANAVAAHRKYGQNCVIVDFGTALSFTTVSAVGNILGVTIVPGLRTAVKSLFANTAQLPQVPLTVPESAIGKNTVHSIQAGILIGYEYLIKGIISKIKEEMGGSCIALATGGLSNRISNLQSVFVETDPLLTLEGLKWIGAYEYEKNKSLNS